MRAITDIRLLRSLSLDAWAITRCWPYPRSRSPWPSPRTRSSPAPPCPRSRSPSPAPPSPPRPPPHPRRQPRATLPVRTIIAGTLGRMQPGCQQSSRDLRARPAPRGSPVRDGRRPGRGLACTPRWLRRAGLAPYVKANVQSMMMDVLFSLALRPGGLPGAAVAVAPGRAHRG